MDSSSLSRRSFVALSAMLPLAWTARPSSNIPVGLELYSVREELKRDPELREAILFLLDQLVENGSSASFKMRDDFVTPASAACFVGSG